MYTSSHKNFNTQLFETVAISGNRGRDAGYEGKCYPKLAPKLEFWQNWHDNIGKISEEENNRYYIEEYYKQVLAKLDPWEIYNELKWKVLLCYEDNMEFCHRHIVAEWLQLLLEVKVPEIKIVNGRFDEIDRPDYIRIYLEDAMRKNLYMRGFKSLRALYLFEQGEALEAKADKLEAQTGRCYDALRQSACYYRCDADEAEYKYISENLERKRLVK